MKTIEVNGQMFLASAITSIAWVEEPRVGFKVYTNGEANHLFTMKYARPFSNTEAEAIWHKSCEELKASFEQAKKDWKKALEELIIYPLKGNEFEPYCTCGSKLTDHFEIQNGYCNHCRDAVDRFNRTVR